MALDPLQERAPHHVSHPPRRATPGREQRLLLARQPLAARRAVIFSSCGGSKISPIEGGSMGPKEAQGFTLIELLVVVVIIGLLAGFVAPRYFSQVGKSEVGVAKAQIDALEKALDTYRLDTGHYPSTELRPAALMQKPAAEPKWSGPYLRKEVPLDPWGKPYVYKMPGEKSDFDLLSYGKDGQPGGTGENADLTNHGGSGAAMRYELKAIAP